MIGEISEITNGNSKDGKFKIWYLKIDGKRYSSLEDCSGFKINDTVEFTVKQKGKFFNITKIRKVFEGNTGTTTPPSPHSFSDKIIENTELSQQRQMVRMNVLNRAVELFIEDRLHFDDEQLKDRKKILDGVFVVAEQMEKWVRGIE